MHGMRKSPLCSLLRSLSIAIGLDAAVSYSCCAGCAYPRLMATGNLMTGPLPPTGGLGDGDGMALPLLVDGEVADGDGDGDALLTPVVAAVADSVCTCTSKTK